MANPAKSCEYREWRMRNGRTVNWAAVRRVLRYRQEVRKLKADGFYECRSWAKLPFEDQLGQVRIVEARIANGGKSLWVKVAQGTEAQRAETVQLGSVHESAAGNAETPDPDSKPVMTIGIDEIVLNDIAAMMSEFVDNWPNPKKVSTALALIAKTMRAALNERDLARRHV